MKTPRHQAQQLVQAIARETGGRTVTLMEVCGTHTMAIHRHGIRSLLPPGIRLLSGPGCPVCVTPVGYLDRAIALSRLPALTIFTFGDMMRVPGSTSSLSREKSQGADIRVAYSPLEALAFARQHPERRVVFLGIGFETTAPAVAALADVAHRAPQKNLFVLSGHKVIPPALALLAQNPELALDGLICPGHVSAILGMAPYRRLARVHRLPCVVTGFEPIDILQGILLLARQVVRHRPAAENQYARVVREEGNPAARRLLARVFAPGDSDWRGLGNIPGSGLALRPRYRRHDAALLPVNVEPPREPRGCRCGAVLSGLALPEDCRLFGRRCTPDTPVGACMVSSEGSCAAAYRYRNPPLARHRNPSHAPAPRR